MAYPTPSPVSNRPPARDRALLSASRARPFASRRATDSATTASATLVWTATFCETRTPSSAARWIVWEASQELGARSCEHPRPVHGARPWRGPRLHRSGCQPAHPGLRHGRGDVPRGAVDRRRRGHLRARAQRAGIHVPAAGRVHHQRACRLHRRRLARPGLRAGRPLPVQRQEVRGRPRSDDRGLRKADARCDRRRLRQHRYRFLDPGRPVASRPSTTSSARTTSARPSSRPSSARTSRPA